MHGTTNVTTPTVVVTDVARPADLVRCVTQARRTLPRDVEVLVISPRPRPLPSGTARAVRVVRVPSGTSTTAAVTAQAERARLVVVLRSDCRLAPGWFEAVVDRCRRAPASIGSVGGADSHLLAFPAAVTSTGAEHETWGPVPGLSLVAGAGGRTPRPVTLGASLIVKDEEEVIGECLAALRDVVDEIVVYDTGSSDATVEIARAHGAVVHLGHWDDHFGDARNRALAHSTTEWVLHVDADEVFTGDAAALRARLAAEQADMLRVVVVSTQWKGATEGEESRPVRIFRREKFEWTGHLHEHLVPRAGVSGVTLAPGCLDVRLLHSGYQQTVFVEKSKIARNVDISAAAARALAPGDPQASTVWSNYGRSLVSAGRTDEALTALEHLFAPGANASAAVAGARSAVLVLVGAGRWEEVERWLELLAVHGEASGNIAAVRARRSVADGDLDAAEGHLDAAGDDLDVWGAPHDRSAVRALRVDVAAARGRTLDAGELLRRELRDHPETVDVDRLLRGTLEAGGSLADLASLAPEAFVARSLRVAFGLSHTVAMRWFEALLAARPDDPRALVAACVAAGRGDLGTAIVWAARAREAGADLSPLRDYAEQENRSPVERATALAVLADAFADADARVELVAATAGLRTVELRALGRRCAEMGVALPADRGLATEGAPC